jgi:hypothetical protein
VSISGFEVILSIEIKSSGPNGEREREERAI